MNQTESADRRISLFLDKLVSPLERTLDASSLSEFRNSSEFHLECLVNEYRGNGLPETDAVTQALAEFGPADRMALAMLDEWCRGRRASGFSRSSSAAFWWSFALFGIAAGCSLLAFQIPEMWPVQVSSLPTVEVISCVGSVFAGIGVGCRVPTGNLRALGVAFLPLFIHALLAAFLMGPSQLSKQYLVLFVCLWAPLGAVSVSLTAWLRRNRPIRKRVFRTKEVSR